MTVLEILVNSTGPVVFKSDPIPVYFNVEDLTGDVCIVDDTTKNIFDDLLGEKDLEVCVFNELFKLRFNSNAVVTLFDTNMTSQYFNTLTHSRNGTYEPPPISDGPFERKLREITNATWLVFLFAESGYFSGVTVNQNEHIVVYLDSLHLDGKQILRSVMDFLCKEYSRQGVPFNVNEWTIVMNHSKTMDIQLPNSKGQHTGCGIYLFLMVCLELLDIPISILKQRHVHLTRLHLLKKILQ